MTLHPKAGSNECLGEARSPSMFAARGALLTGPLVPSTELGLSGASLAGTTGTVMLVEQTGPMVVGEDRRQRRSMGVQTMRGAGRSDRVAP